MAIHIRRREFIGTLGGAAAAWPLAARAQQPEHVRRIGVLMGIEILTRNPEPLHFRNDLKAWAENDGNLRNRLSVDAAECGSSAQGCR